MMVRTTPELHRDLRMLAVGLEMSLNTLCVLALEELFADPDRAAAPPPDGV